MRPAIFITAAVLFAAACTESQPKKQPVAEGWVRHSTAAFTVDAPEEWEFDTAQGMGTEFVLFAPWDTASSMFRENVNAVTEELEPGQFNTKTYIEQAQKLLAEYMTDMRDVQVTPDGERYWLRFNAQQGTVRLYFTQMMEVKDDRAYIVTFTTNRAENTPVLATAEKIIASFDRK